MDEFQYASEFVIIIFYRAYNSETDRCFLKSSTLTGSSARLSGCYCYRDETVGVQGKPTLHLSILRGDYFWLTAAYCWSRCYFLIVHYVLCYAGQNHFVSEEKCHIYRIEPLTWHVSSSTL